MKNSVRENSDRLFGVKKMNKEFLKNIKMRSVKESLKKGYSVEEDGELWGMRNLRVETSDGKYVITQGYDDGWYISIFKKDKKNFRCNTCLLLQGWSFFEMADAKYVWPLI